MFDLKFSPLSIQSITFILFCTELWCQKLATDNQLQHLGNGENTGITIYCTSGEELLKALHIMLADSYNNSVREVVNIQILQMQCYLPF